MNAWEIEKPLFNTDIILSKEEASDKSFIFKISKFKSIFFPSIFFVSLIKSSYNFIFPDIGLGSDSFSLNNQVSDTSPFIFLLLFILIVICSFTFLLNSSSLYGGKHFFMFSLYLNLSYLLNILDILKLLTLRILYLSINISLSKIIIL